MITAATIATVALLMTTRLVSSQSCPVECQCIDATKNTTCAFTVPITFPAVPAWTQQLIIKGPAVESVTILNTVLQSDLQSLENLTELTLSQLGITSLNADTFSSSAQLKRLDLSANDLTLLPTGVFDNLSKLTYLDISKNKLKSITTAYLNFPELSVLSLEGNSFQLQDASIFQYLKKLHLLDISDSVVGDPIPNYQGPTDLGIVTLANCSIKTLSNKFTNFVKKASRLDLQNNEITELPATFVPNLSLLKELYLNNNSINVLRNLSFDYMEAFEVSLAHNSISTIEQAAFDDLRTIVLNLEGNRLTSLPPRLFYHVQVDRLFLNDNPLQVLNSETFSGMEPYRKIGVALDLRNAQIAQIADDAFTGSQIDDLDLSYNKLTWISNETLLTISSVRTVNLTENPWNCTVDLIPLRRWLLSRSESSNCEEPTATNCLRCVSPDRYAGALVVSLSEADLSTAMDPPTTMPIPTTTIIPTTTAAAPVYTTVPTELPTTEESSTTPAIGPQSPTFDSSQFAPSINIVYYVCAAIVVPILIIVICLIAKTCYKWREVSYPVGQKELENGYIPETELKTDSSVQLERIFSVQGHTNPSFHMNCDDETESLTMSTTSLRTFRRGHEPCRDSGIDCPGSDQSINRPVQHAWVRTSGGYENRTYNHSDDLT